MALKRIFIAVDYQPDSDFLDYFSFLRRELRNEDIKWSSTQNFHITLKFFGDTPEDQISSIIHPLDGITKKHSSFQIQPGHLGVFGDFKQARVLWLGINETSGTLESLAHEIAQAFPSAPSDKNNSFTPHLTLGRPKFIRQPNLLKTLVESSVEKVFNPFTIREVLLIWSTLTPLGPQYKTLKSFPLQSTSLG